MGTQWLRRIKKESTLVILVILLTITFVFRITNIGQKDFWYDEAVIFWIAEVDLSLLIMRNAEMNSAPPLYPFIIAVVHLLSTQEAILRLPSAVLGSVSVIVLYALMREFSSKPSALLCAMLMCFSPIHIQYSQELREYSGVILVSALISLFFIRYIRTNNPGYLIPLVTVMITGVFLHYGIVIIIFGVNLTFFIHWVYCARKLRQLSAWFTSQLLVIISLLIVYAVALQDQFDVGGFASSGYLASAYWDGTLVGFFRLAVWNTYILSRLGFNSGLLTLEAGQPALAFVLLVVLGGIALMRYPKNNWLAILITFCPIVVTIILAVLRIFPYSGGRQNAFLLPMIYIAAAHGFAVLLSAIKRMRIAVSMTVIAVTVVVVFAVPGTMKAVEYLRSNGRAPIDNLVEDYRMQYQPGDNTVVERKVYFPLRYYAPSYEADWTVERFDDTWNKEFAELLEVGGRIWLFCEGECLRWISLIEDKKRMKTLRNTYSNEGYVAYSLILFE